MMSDQEIVAEAARMAKAVDAGETLSKSEVSSLASIAADREALSRHELARQAAAKAGAIGEIALEFLRVAIFALA